MTRRNPNTDEISTDERAYHEALVARVELAQQAHAESQAAFSAWRSWAAHLSVKYELGPDDAITSTGEITRGGTRGE